MSSRRETVIAVYGPVISPERVATFYSFATKAMDALGHPPGFVLISRRSKKGKYTTLRTADAQLAKDGYEDVTAIEVTAGPPESKGKLNTHSASAFIDVGEQFAHFSADASILSLSRNEILPLADEIFRILGRSHGIAYKMPMNLGPTWYAIGICYSKNIDAAIEAESAEADEEDMRISRWGHTYMPARVWEMGLLRDVYPWNFLNAPQLAKLVGKLPLEKWIKQDSSRGTLTPMANGLMFWELTASQIPDVRDALNKADLIIDWEKHRSLVGG
ncbi:MAG TPA: hypothetical protein VH370_06895 [Humisphaera sp.]|jgi:hypothetical protein|nr:hypothetical protein [Humisphaera sp.]